MTDFKKKLDDKTLDDVLNTRLTQLLTERQAIKAEIAEMEKVSEKKKDEIVETIGRLGLDTASGVSVPIPDSDGKRWKIQTQVTERKTVNVMKLLDAGVKSKVIEACTDVKKTEALVIREVKE